MLSVAAVLVCALSVSGALAQTAPEFTQEVYSISVNESNQAAGFPRPQNGFITVTCIDPTTNNTPIAVTYTILDGSLPFGIDDSSGALSVTQDLDYDTPPRSYEFNVSCYNGSSPELNSTALVSITLDPVNDNVPVLSRNSFQVLILETTPPGTLLASTQPGAIQMYSVTDADIGEGGDVVFTLSESSEDPEFFTLDMDNGNLVLSQTIDIDSTNRTIIGGFIRFSTRITVCDTNPPSEQCPNLLVEVLELPVNDHLPQFSNDSYFASYPETTVTGTVLVVATCTDGDRPGTIGSFSGITLSNPTQNVVDHFMVDDATGSISLIQELDYEMDQMFNFTVLCSDTGGSTTAAQVIIDVIPENDNFPLFTNSTIGTFSYNFSLSRTAPIGFVVSQVTATDADVGTTTEITYGIEPNEYFNIENTTGVITVSNSIVNSTDEFLTINVTVSDGTLSSSALVSVEVTSGNFDRPEFQRDNITFQINELTTVGTNIETFLCTDADMGSKAEISYSINSVSGLFQINSTSGALMVAMPLLLTDNNSAIVTYTLNISCEDNGIPVFSDSTLSFVQVYKDDSNPPIINNSNTEVYANEDAPTGEVIVIITATDADTAELSFSLVNASVPGTFIINSTTGVVTLNTNLDRELISEYQFTVVVTEIREAPGIAPGLPQSATADFTILIRDVNDNAPQCQNTTDALSATITVGIYDSVLLLSLSCSDSDVGNNQVLFYSFVQSTLPMLDRGRFELNQMNGQLRFEGMLIHTATYIVSILIFDSGIPQQSSQVSVKIQVVPFEVELYIIIVPILVGLILLILFLIVCIVCCVCCNRERVKRKQNYLLSGEVAGSEVKQNDAAVQEFKLTFIESGSEPTSADDTAHAMELTSTQDTWDEQIPQEVVFESEVTQATEAESDLIKEEEGTSNAEPPSTAESAAIPPEPHLRKEEEGTSSAEPPSTAESAAIPPEPHLRKEEEGTSSAEPPSTAESAAIPLGKSVAEEGESSAMHGSQELLLQDEGKEVNKEETAQEETVEQESTSNNEGCESTQF